MNVVLTDPQLRQLAIYIVLAYQAMTEQSSVYHPPIAPNGHQPAGPVAQG